MKYLISSIIFTFIGVGIGYQLFYPSHGEVSNESVVITQQENKDIDSIVKNLDPSEALSSFKVETAMKSGKFVGYRVTWVKNGSTLDKAGLQVGDIISSVGGQNVSEPPKGKAISFLKSLKNQK